MGRTFGAKGFTLRAAHELRRIAGAFRLEPRYEPQGKLAEASRAFEVDTDTLRDVCQSEQAISRAERVVHGAYQAYRWDWRRLPSDPAGWLVHPITSAAHPSNVPWWTVLHFHAGLGDIKDLWEPARLAWAYDLIRAYLLTQDDRYAEAFHVNFERWYTSSPPFRGPHWSCGQETAIRAAALAYAEQNLRSAPSSTPERMARITRTLGASGERIRDAIGYAVSQRNNHGISEAAGLVILGVRFLGQHPEAQRWLDGGHRILERLVRDQFAQDGWYIQHSFTYLRVALDQLVLAERSLRAVGRSLSGDVVDRVRAAVELLLAVIDPESGDVPNHGANDGAFVHPITLASYRDFRSTVTAVCGTWRHPMPANLSPDEEVLAWLNLDLPSTRACSGDRVRWGPSGWASAKIGTVSVFLRAGRYTSRPGHLDPLHLDVRVGDKNVIVDPGTYSYAAPPPWRNGLVTAHVHNGPLLDGVEPGVRGPRFLWYIWPTATLVRAELARNGAIIVAEVPQRIRRTVHVDRVGVTVEDEPLDATARTISTLWTLHPAAEADAISAIGATRRIDPEPHKLRAWYSPHYGELIPTRALEVSAEVQLGTKLITHIKVGPTTGL